MERIRSIGRFLCCCSRQEPPGTPLFLKKCHCCGEDQYIEAETRHDILQIPFFVERRGVYCEILGTDSVEVLDEFFRHDFQEKKTITDARIKEEDATIKFCCCLSMRDPNKKRDYPCNVRKVTSRKEKDTHVYSLALEKVVKLDNQKPIGKFRVRTFKQICPQDPHIIAANMRDALQSANVTVPLLEVRIHEEGYRPFVELTNFQHLSLKTSETVQVTEKMMNCGFLNISAPILNRFEVDHFKGFGIVIGNISVNRYSFKSLHIYIERWMKNIPSPLDCYGLFDTLQTPGVEAVWKQFSMYKPTGKIIGCEDGIDVMILDDDNDAALLFPFKRGICFVKGGWKKWKSVFLSLRQTLV